MLQVVVTLLIAVALVVPTGRYLYRVLSGGPAPLDRVFLPVERLIYRLIGERNPDSNMNWKTYAVAFLLHNFTIALLVYLIVRLQGYLPLNPQGFGAMEPFLSLNVAISFITNTTLQHYTGESTMSYLSQMVALTFLMFAASSSDFAVAVAFMRGLVGRPLGNFWSDITRIIVRVMLPAAFLVALVMAWQGVPQTLLPTIKATTVEGAVQNIAVGPVASLESIKHIGTNGGGFFNANSAHPFENPTPLTNLVQILCMLWLPTSLLYTFGLFAKNKRQGWVLFIAAGILFIGLLGTALHFEGLGNPRLHALGLAGPSMEGKEVRFGTAESALFATVTTTATTGSVNAMHDSLSPMGGFTTLMGMLLNLVFGGKGSGLMYLLAITMVSVFVVGLMVGRTPQILHKKLQTKEIVLLSFVILLHPLLVLAPSALALITAAGKAGISHTGFHGLTQVVYEYASVAANNGSEFAGLNGNTPFWNITDAVVMYLGRYPALIALLAVAGFLAAKKPVPEGPGTLRTDTPLFTVVLVGVIVILGALTYLPALALGPIAEHLTLFAGK